MTADQATPRRGQAAGPVLVIIDVQEWIMHLPLGPRPGTRVAAACRDLREAVLADGGVVLYVRYLRQNGSDGGPHGAAQIAADLHPISDHLVIDKYGVDAFDNTQLHAYLQSMKASTGILAGLRGTCRCAAPAGADSRCHRGSLSGSRSA